MCTRTIHINDSLMEQVRPMFPTDEDLQRWLEKQMESVLVHFSTQQRPCSYSEEEMYAIVKKRLQSLEEGTAELVDGEEVFSKLMLFPEDAEELVGKTLDEVIAEWDRMVIEEW